MKKSLLEKPKAQPRVRKSLTYKEKAWLLNHYLYEYAYEHQLKFWRGEHHHIGFASETMFEANGWLLGDSPSLHSLTEQGKRHIEFLFPKEIEREICYMRYGTAIAQYHDENETRILEQMRLLSGQSKMYGYFNGHRDEDAWRWYFQVLVSDTPSYLGLLSISVTETRPQASIGVDGLWIRTQEHLTEFTALMEKMLAAAQYIERETSNLPKLEDFLPQEQENDSDE